jgi:hypothetical protein
MKTQSPTATIVAEPLGDLFARGGFVKTVCCNCLCSVVRVVAFNSLHMCEECCAEWFDLFVVARRPEWMWDALWQAVDDHAVPDLFLKKTKAFVHQYGHKACTRRFGDFK